MTLWRWSDVCVCLEIIWFNTVELILIFLGHKEHLPFAYYCFWHMDLMICERSSQTSSHYNLECTSSISDPRWATWPHSFCLNLFRSERLKPLNDLMSQNPDGVSRVTSYNVGEEYFTVLSLSKRANNPFSYSSCEHSVTRCAMLGFSFSSHSRLLTGVTAARCMKSALR